MKTPTRSYIIEIIKKNGSVRPSELAESLQISPQAIHKHLRALVSAGIIEPKGRPPSTRYLIVGTPDFSRALTWFRATDIPGPSPDVCETRDVFAGRLSRLTLLVNQGLPEEDLPLIISVCGEIGNNSFDHNLGQWQDVPGCWFETQLTHCQLWILIADRGQGIYHSLARVDPNIPSEQIAVEKAFREHISGRAPEQRGNGLKYVANIIFNRPKAGLACRSGNGRICLGERGKDCSTILETFSSPTNGTITLIAWERR